MFIILTCFVFAAAILLPLLLKWHQNTYYGDASKIPGPPSMFLFGNVFDFGFNMEDTFNALMNLQKQYGSFLGIWLGSFKFRIVITDPDSIRKILTTNVHLNKGSTYDSLEPLLGKGLLTSEATIWKVQRKRIEPTFHIKLFKHFVEVFNSMSNTLVDILIRESTNGPIDVCPLIHLYTLDVVCETIMGVTLNIQQNENKEYIKAFDNFLDLAVLKFFSIFRRFKPYYRLTPDYKREMKALKIVKDMTSIIIKNRQKDIEKYKNTNSNSINKRLFQKKKLTFLDLLLNETDFTEIEINDQVNTFMLGGHRTISSALGFLLFEIAKRPTMQEEIVKEIHSVVGRNDEPITLTHIQEFKFTERVIKETMRLYSPTPFFERILEHDEIIGGYMLPKNANVMVNVFALHRDNKHFPDPEMFDPDRFLAENVAKRHPFSYIPFSHGTRSCIASRFAMSHMKVFVANVLRKLEFTSTVPKHIPRLASNGILRSINGLKINVKVRDV